MSSPLAMLKKNKRAPLRGPSSHRGGQGGDAFRGHLYTESPPSDLELMSSMMQRLTQLEVKVKSQAQEMELKEKQITILERKLNLPPEPKKDVDGKEDLAKTCRRLQTQVTQMEHFLSDYGLTWVGDGEDRSGAVRLEQEEAVQEQTMWHPDTSAVVTGFHMNFDLVLRNIRQLNIVAGEGESFVQATAVGAQLSTRDPIRLRLYSNGILMFEGPFRSYREPCTQRCLQDLMDGYFPSELQGRYPDGVPFEVHDHRHEEFTERPLWTEFPGKGLTVGAVKNTASATPGRKLTMDQFLNRLPKVVVKGGKVIDVRSSVKATLQGSSDSQNNPAILIDTPAVRAMDERLRSRGSPAADAEDVATLRVKSEDGNHSYIVKMLGSETIGHLRQYLDGHRGKGLPGYDIISVFPQQCYSDESQTLASCGLTPSATVLLRPQKGSSQSTSPSN
ncbi:UBX domain-containing protein 11 [Merluccius polli]|uniref:UBX domain-containing protein 11 n=1 Tax=Merluccius polli TaxID=89951 RepID=A0AA47MIG0_MERPO|nr:UBX domain-containing protein 11 [Merluccius polli]